MLVAVAVFSVMDALLKLLAAHYPPMQVAFLRGVTSHAVRAAAGAAARARSRGCAS